MGWTDELLTGIAEIDAQHQVLFDCLKRLKEAISLEERWSVCHFALDEVADFARIHFAVEESLLRLHGYPALAAHIAEHRAFSAELLDIKERSLRSDVTDETVAFLENWLRRHIGETDHAYLPHLRTAPVAIS